MIELARLFFFVVFASALFVPVFALFLLGAPPPAALPFLLLAVGAVRVAVVRIVAVVLAIHHVAGFGVAVVVLIIAPIVLRIGTVQLFLHCHGALLPARD
eukprot:9501556-Pyramimonas_sp.AAC.2